MRKDEANSSGLELADQPGYARFRGDPRGGRSDEFRLGERLRGDTGGGPREDGVPDVPHDPADPPPSSAPSGVEGPTVLVLDLREESAILEVEERFDEPALVPLSDPLVLWAEAMAELAWRLSKV